VSISHQALSKAISPALRHEPWLYELELDDEGWTSLNTLIESLRSKGDCWDSLYREQIEAMIASSDKIRHEIRGDRIRALYGHSLPGKLKRLAAIPPEVLYHGTSPEAAEMIRRAGLEPMGRQYVHLSSDRPTAGRVGRRKSDEPVILEIAAKAASAKGVAFYEGNKKVWLADAVPPEFITQISAPPPCPG